MACSVKVYGPTLSTAVNRVLACLFGKEVPFELLPVNMAKGDHKKPEYLKLHPFGQVPAFEDKQIRLFESRAICRYISKKYASQGNETLFGPGLLERASIDLWLEVEGQNFSPPSSALLFQLAFPPRMKMKQDPAVIARTKRNWVRWWTYMRRGWERVNIWLEMSSLWQIYLTYPIFSIWCQ